MSTTASGSGYSRFDQVAVVGGGAWGTTLALLAIRAGNSAALLVRTQERAAEMSHSRRHPYSLPDIELPKEVFITASAEEALATANIVVLALPTQELRNALTGLAPHLRGKIIVSSTKGLERRTFLRSSEVIADVLASSDAGAICALSGPNLAAEVAAGRPATTVVASANQDVAEDVRRALMSAQFRIYTTRDVSGVEMGGALKNVIAIGAGIGDGLGAGDNAKAAFLTRGITEIARLGIACGAEPLTFAGLSGIGDLIATCASPLSRNNRVGRELAKGRPLAAVLGEIGEVAEGVPTTEAAHALGRKLGVELPIVAQMHDVLFAGKSPLTAVNELMSREPKQELSGFNG